jgi:hypothetical protein
MDLFSSDYIKILKYIDKKKARQGDDAMTPKVGLKKNAGNKGRGVQNTVQKGV